MSSTVCKIAWLAALAAACGGADKGPAADLPVSAASEGGDGAASDEKDGVVVSGTKGRLEVEEIRAGIVPRTAELEACYKTELKAKAFLSGKVLLEVHVATTGQVGAAAIVQSDVGDWAVERCLLGVTRQMTFAKPKGGDGQATFRFPVNFASDQPALESWPEERIAPVVAEKRAALDACGAAPAGAAATLYIGNRGAVQAVGFAAAPEGVAPVSLPPPAPDSWVDCAAAAIAAWTFPDPQGTIVKASFRLAPAAPEQ